MNSDGTAPRQLTFTGTHGQLPDWSPDGTKIAYETDTPHGGRIWVMNTDGSSAPAVAAAGDQFIPAWQPLPGHNSQQTT